MLNFVAAQILSWTVHGPLMEASRAYPQSMPIAPSAEMYMFLPPTRLNLGMILALVLALAMYLFLFRSDVGFQLRAMGNNRRAANFFRIPIASLTDLDDGAERRARRTRRRGPDFRHQSSPV